MDKPIEEQRELVAKYIMKWERETIEVDGIGGVGKETYWTTPARRRVYDYEWTPEADRSQALDVAEALNQHGWHVTLELPISSRKACRACNMKPVPDYLNIYRSDNYLSQAIFGVAVKIAEQMEKEANS